MKSSIYLNRRVFVMDCRKQPQCYFWLHSWISIWENKHSRFCSEHYFLSFLWLYLNTQDFIYLEFHYENTPIQIYWKLHHQNWKFSDKYSDIFLHVSAQNIDCWYSLEPPRRGGSNEYPQSMFLSRNKKNNVYPCKPQFYCIKVGFKGVKTI